MVRETHKKWMLVIAGLVIGSSLSGFVVYGRRLVQAAASMRAGESCDYNIGAARRDPGAASTGTGTAVSAGAFTPAGWTPKINDSKPPEAAPEGMVWIPGGQFWMGTTENRMTDALPWHRVYVDGYWMDQTDVTNEQFARFVKATGYRTVAERKPRPEDYPGAPPEKLVAGSVVFSPPDHPVELDNHYRWWNYVPGANWRHPEGPGSDIKNRMNHPVVHIAYEDALAYCKWTGTRLPTEAEFEFASRGGLDRKRYAWGDALMPGGGHMANTFQGHFPDKNTGEDGYIATSPVGSFPANGYGLFDMAGNVWEWTSDWYRADYYATLAAGGEVVINPQGPADSLDPNEPGVRKRVQRGGSFLCTDQYCARYVAGGRGKGELDTGTNHLGFRCVREPGRKPATSTEADLLPHRTPAPPAAQ
ncbi:MAG TPA: formylglycine-generating enzyme family protein [Bryobacteraceae bacterium]|nr:formylglycine-generating enzyme family protein [Bryobacteraceae bacterium]